jgi:hypothetical protein
MPLSTFQTSQNRLSFEGALTTTEVAALAANQSLEILQTSGPSDIKTWELLNASLFKLRPDVGLRVYGHYDSCCNLSFVSKLTNLRKFSADCLSEASGIDSVLSLENLERLDIGIFNLDNFDFLANIDASRLTHLSLGATRSKKPNLKFLSRFSLLEQLYVEGHKKEIDVIGELKKLKDLTLRSITVPSLNFLRNLSQLWSLDIKLGGISNLDDLAPLTGIKYLELWQIKGLSNISSISQMSGLQNIFLQSLSQVKSLPNLSRLSSLKRLNLENMRGLMDLSALATAPALEEFIYVSAQGREPSEFASLLSIGRMKRMSVGFGSEKKNLELKLMQEIAGVDSYRYSPFVYK